MFEFSITQKENFGTCSRTLFMSIRTVLVILHADILKAEIGTGFIDGPVVGPDFQFGRIRTVYVGLAFDVPTDIMRCKHEICFSVEIKIFLVRF